MTRCGMIGRLTISILILSFVFISTIYAERAIVSPYTSKLDFIGIQDVTNDLATDQCTADQIIKKNSANTGWACAADDTGTGGQWTDTGTTIHPTETGDEVVVGATSPVSSAKFSVDGDADQIQGLFQGNSTQTSDIVVVESSDGTDILTGADGGLKISSSLEITERLALSGLNCLGYTNGGSLTVDSNGSVTCSDDDSASISTDQVGVNELDDGTDTASIDDVVMIDNGDTTQFIYIDVPDCDDGAGHVNYDTTTQAFSCGTVDDDVPEAGDFGAGTDLDVNGAISCTDCLGTTEIADSYVLNSGDTMTGALTVDGSADANQLLVQGNATQTNDILVVEQSDGTDVLTGAVGGVKITGTLEVTGEPVFSGRNCLGGVLTAESSGQVRCKDDDDIPESGDFGAAGDLESDGTISVNAVALATDTTGNYVATIADAGNSNITVTNSGAENAAVTLDVVDVTCTNCLGTTEIADSYVLNAGDTMTGSLTIDGSADVNQLLVQGNATQTNDILVVEQSDTTDILTGAAGGVKVTGALEVTTQVTFSGLDCSGNSNGGALTAGSSGQIICTDDDSAAGGGDNVTVNSSAVDTTANLLDGDIDFTLVDGGAGGPDDITATVACTDCVDATDLKDTDAPADEECLTYESTGTTFEWQSCGGGTANTSIILPVQSAKITGSFATDGDATQGAQIDAGDGNWRLLFDATTDEGAVWGFRMPNNYSSAPVLKIGYTMASATSLEVEFEGAIMCVTDADAADVGTASFSTIAVGSATVPGTLGYLDEISITLTDDSCASGDFTYVYLSTDANDATNDDATGDREVVYVMLTYTGS